VTSTVSRLIFVVLAVGILGAGSVRAQDGEPGERDITEEYEEIVRTLTPGGERSELRLSLREARSMALRNNLDLQITMFNPSISRASLDDANTLYDTLFTSSATGGESKQPVVVNFAGEVGQLESDTFRGTMALRRLLPTGGNVSLGVSTDRTLSNAGFSALNRRYESNATLFLSQPLLRTAGRDYTEAGIRFSEDQLDISTLDLRNKTEALVRDVELSYWNLVNSLGQVLVQRRSLDVAQDLLRIAEARLQSGAGTQVDVSQAGAGVALREVDLLKAENAVRVSQESLLGLLMTRTPGTDMAKTLRIVPADDPRADLPALPDEDLETGVEQALMDRSDLEILRYRVSQTEITVMRAESDVLAKLDLSGSVSYAGLDGGFSTSFNDSMASRRFPTYNVGLFLEIPIGNRSARARLERAILQRSQAEARVRALQSNVSVRVRNARRDLESARREIDAALRAVALSEEQLAAERERLRVDKSTTFNVLDLEEDLTSARTSFIEALVDYRSAMAAYDFERGRILERRGLAPPPPSGPGGSGTTGAESESNPE
jgi:outer membrane protein TolC